jgi:hypothetical protein
MEISEKCTSFVFIVYVLSNVDDGTVRFIGDVATHPLDCMVS